MRRFDSLPIKQKLVLIISLIGSIALLLASAVFMTYDQLSARKALEQDLHTLASITAYNSRAALDLEDTTRLESNLAALQIRRHVMSAAFYKNGQLFFQYTRDASRNVPATSKPDSDGAQFSKGTLTIFHPVIDPEGKRIGTLFIAYALDELRSRLVRFALIVVLILIGVSIVTIWLSAKLQRFISEPILELARTARIVSEKKDFSVRTQKQTNDEVGFLVDQFNTMLSHIEARDHELREKNKQLIESEQAALAATQAKSQFLANMSHELRTPLNAIIGFSEILYDRTFGELNDRQARYAQNILNSGKHLLQLINDILDLAKIEAGKLQLDRTSFNPGSALEDIHHVVRTLANKKGITVSISASPDLPPLFADQAKFKQIMYNLLSNAIKFTPNGGIVSVSATLENNPTIPAWGSSETTSLQGNFVCIAVSDTGIGIKREDHDRVFQEFEQVDSSYARQQQGTGLGLPLTRKLVELHGGRIWLESEGIEGKGSRFAFVLPVEIRSEKAEPRESALPENGSSTSLKVLVVEDDPHASELITEYLTWAGYRVIHASDGEQAIHLAREHLPDAITLDVVLPRKSGWDVLHELKADPITREIPVVIVSITNERELGMSLGAIDYFVKPVSREELVAAIDKIRKATGQDVQMVLIVDDEPQSVEVIANMLRTESYQVLLALDGQQGIDLAVKHQPDILILDLIMPHLNGFDVVRRLRANPETANIPILIHTAKDLTPEDYAQLRNHVHSITSKSARDELLGELHRLSRLHPARTKRSTTENTEKRE